MSRCSTPSVSTIESTDDDPLMRDCFELRRRLILTEKSLKNLNPQTSLKDMEDAASETSRNKDHTSPIPLLTLDDLTPISSANDNLKTNDELYSSGRPFSYQEITRQNEANSARSEENQSGSRSFPNQFDFSNSDPSSMRKKLLNIRDENSRLFAQNNHLVTQLEDTAYQLNDSQTKIKMKDDLLNEHRAEKAKQSEHITYLEQEIMENELQIRNLMKNEELLNRRNSLKDSEINKLKTDLADVEDDYNQELNIRKSIEIKLEESLHAGEQMKQKLMDIRDQMQNEIKSNNESERILRQTLKDYEREKQALFDKTIELEENLLKTEKTLRKENEALTSSLDEERILINNLEENLNIANEKEREHEGLIEEKEDKIREYQTEVTGAKIQMQRLETLVQQVQENAMKSQIMNTPLTSDSGISNNFMQSNSQLNASPTFMARNSSDHYQIEENSPGKSKSIIADFEMKLAKKDVEIQKLQAALTSRNAAQQRSFAGLDEVSASSMNGLRSELSAVVERSRMGDKKQHELEMIITRLEDDLARYSNQIMILEERLTDKLAHISSLEAKVSQKNLKLSAMQNETDRNVERIAEAENELRKRDTRIKNLENEMQNNKARIKESSGQVKNFEAVIDEKIKKITELQGIIHLKEADKNQATSLVDKVKKLHSEQCRELEQQIELLQQRVEAKTLQIENLESNLSATERELDMKNSICNDLQEELEKSRANLEERSQLLLQHENKLKTLQEHLAKESKQVGNLEHSLSNCKNELNVILENTELVKEDSKAELKSIHAEYQRLNDLFTKAKEELGKKTNELINLRESLKQRDDMLVQSQNRITELEEYQEHLDETQRKHRNQTSLEKQKIEDDFMGLKVKLENSAETLEIQIKQINELESALKESHSELKLRTEKVDELEMLLKEMQNLSDKKSKHVVDLEEKTKFCDARIEDLVAKNHEIEKKFNDADKRCNAATSKANELDNELLIVQKELKQTVSDLSMLHKVLNDNQKEIQQKEEKVSELDRMLNLSQEENQQKKIELQEKSMKLIMMDEAMKEHQLELKQKAVAVTQLDMTFKEQQSEFQHKLLTSEHNLNMTVEELNQRTIENAELSAKLDQLKDKMEEKSNETVNLNNLIQRQKIQLKEKLAKLTSFGEEIEKFKRKEEEYLHTEQELLLTKENQRQLNEELQSARRELMKRERNETELANELDDCHVLLKSKEADCTRLARDLGASQVREAQGEARSIQELQKITQQLQFKIKQTEQEAEKTQDKQSKKLVSQEQELTKLKLSIQSLKDENRLIANDLQRSQQRVNEQEEDIKSLSRQLQLQQNQAKELSENSLIKEAEITRLEARISGYERATFGFRASRPSRPSTPVTPVTYGALQNSPPPKRPVSATPQLGHGRSITTNNEELVPNLQASWKVSQISGTNIPSSSKTVKQGGRTFENSNVFSDFTDFYDHSGRKRRENQLFDGNDDILGNSAGKLSFKLS